MIKDLVAVPLGWLERHLTSHLERRVFEEERLVVAVTEDLIRTMEELKVSRATLAEALGTSKANVTQLLSGQRNLTLRTLARIAFELDRRVEMRLGDLEKIERKPLEVQDQATYWTSPDFVAENDAQIPLPVFADLDLSAEIMANTADHSIAGLAA